MIKEKPALIAIYVGAGMGITLAFVIGSLYNKKKQQRALEEFKKRDTILYEQVKKQEKTYEEYSSKVVLAKDVASNQDDFILCFSFWDLNELPSIQPRAGSLYVFSSSEPHNEEQAMDFRRLHHWLERFGLRGFGLPVEKDGDWEDT
jgi:ribonuclease J